MGIVRLLVREKSGAWYVDQGLMLRSKADELKGRWDESGYLAVIVGDVELESIPIVSRLRPPEEWLRRSKLSRVDY